MTQKLNYSLECYLFKPWFEIENQLFPSLVNSSIEKIDFIFFKNGLTMNIKIPLFSFNLLRILSNFTLITFSFKHFFHGPRPFRLISHYFVPSHIVYKWFVNQSTISECERGPPVTRVPFLPCGEQPAERKTTKGVIKFRIISIGLIFLGAPLSAHTCRIFLYSS